jgi:tRNA1(Val) A37 N6-methylase TrmN6
MNEMILYNFLNKRYSTRNLSDIEFEKILPVLSQELEQLSYLNFYTEDKLKKDWNDLCNWKNEKTYINSTNRIGMKLCEHFFPNFYEIENNKGQSFSNLWKKDNLEKILRWNRKSHSTPYLSELKRGIYFCCGLTKNTMYRPQMAKLVCMKYSPKIVLDPCAGWGGRMLGVVSSGADYIAFEPNTKTYENLLCLSKFLNIENKVRIICDDAMNMLKYDLPKVDCVLTSPPYFDVEIYTHEKTQSVTNYDSYEKWSEHFLKSILKKSLSFLNTDGVSCWNVGKVGKNDMNDDVLKYHMENNFNKIETFSVISSKRQSLQRTGSDKSLDETNVYATVVK